jgi:symplekin
LGADIEKFAIDNLRKACNVNGSAAADGDAVMANAGGGAEGVDAAGVKKEGGGMHFVRDVHLFMALCAKRHELLHVLVATYVECAVDVRSSVQECVQQLGMIKAIGAESNVLLAILGDLPKGAELLLLVFVRTLTYVFDPAQHKKLLDALKGLYARTGDSRFMIYICSALSRAEVEELLPKFVGLRKEGVEAVLRRLLHSKNSPLTPEKLLLALHKLSPRKDNAKENAAAPLHEDRRGPILTAPVPSVGVGAPEQHFAFATAHDGDVAASSVIAILEAEDKQKTNDQEENRKTPLTKKKIVEAVELCFNDKAVFTTQRLAIVLQQLIDQSPLPDFFCQTVLLALKACPTLEGWIVQNILHRLSAIRQVWTMPSLWKGFIKCCHKTLPRSCGVLVNLPREKLSQAVTECEELGEPLAMYVKDQRVRGNPCPEHVLKIVDPWMHGGRGRGGGARPSAREDNMKAGSDGEAPEESR